MRQVLFLRRSWRLGAIGALAAALMASGTAASANVLVGNPFLTSYENWVDPDMPTSKPPTVLGDWRIHLGNGTLMETSDIVPTPAIPSPPSNSGQYTPSLMIQDGFVTPSTYDFTTRLYTSDDDGFGVVFGRQDNGDYFRVFLRHQSNGNLGGTRGLSVQKVIGGVVTQISPMGTGAGNLDIPLADIIANHLPIDLTVSVDGPNYSVSAAGVNGGQAIISGTDNDLQPGKIGIQSWAQRVVGSARHWGTEAESVSVSDGSGVLYSGNFTNMPHQWRELYMANAAGVRTNETATGDEIGHMGLDFRNGWIYDRTNAFEWGTASAPNTDFIGPAVVIDDAGATDFSDYEMRVRMAAFDDDGIGVLLRVQDDDTFYRVNFSAQTIATQTPGNDWERAPQGMSIQKVQDGVWTELFRDDQDNPLFVYPSLSATSVVPTDPGAAVWDVSVEVVGNEIKVTVISDPDGAANVIEYPVVIDANDPLLTGTVGLTKWGNEFTYFLPYGGVDGPLLVQVPEPSGVALIGLGACMSATFVARRRRSVR